MINLSLDERLNLYSAIAAELERCEFIRTEFFRNPSCKINGRQTDSGFELSIAITEPPEDIFKSYLMTLRKFLADKEPTQFGKTVNHIIHDNTIPLLSEIAGKLKVDFKSACETTTFPFYVNETQLKARQVRDLFLNGQYFHSDLSQIQVLNAVSGRPEHLILKYLFLVIARDVYAPIANLATAIKGRHDSDFLHYWLDKLNEPPLKTDEE